ncbi:MAG: hypothetical protein WBN09_10410 [Woeseiaceae bacterium]
MSSFVSQLKERNIWRVVVAYPSVTFVLLQAVEFFINHYGLDQRTLSLTIVIAIVLFPAAVLWNWRHGEAGAQAFSRGELSAYALSAVAAVLAASWYWQSTPEPAATRAESLPPSRSIAVMPFENAADDAEVQFLCDGIAESLINWLATIPDLHVVSKSAAFRMREFSDDTGRLARELGVDSVIRGRLEIVANQVIVSASMVDARDERQVWGDRIAEPRADIISVERSMVAAIKDGLRLTVDQELPVVSAAGGTDKPDAYEAYLRGHYLIQSTNVESIIAGLDELREAIRLDPSFALPYADIADALAQSISYGQFESEALTSEARNAAYASIALAPQLAEAHTALGTLHSIDLEWDAAYAAFSDAIAMKPQRPAPYHRFADHLIITARHAEAVQMAKAALAIDSLDSSSMHALGVSYMALGEYQKSADVMAEWNRFHPDSRWSYVKYALALAHNGQCEQAQTQALTAERMMNNAPAPLIDSWMAWGHKLCGHDELYARSKARIQAHRVENPGLRNPGYVYLMALEGDADGVAEFMQAVVDNSEPFSAFSKIFVMSNLKLGIADKMLANERYQALLERLNYPD